MMRGGVLTPSAVEDEEPYVLIGLPAVVLLRALARSPRGRKLELADGFVVSEEQLPPLEEDSDQDAEDPDLDPDSKPRLRRVWDKMMSAKSALEQAGLDDASMELLEVSVVVGQADASGLSDKARAQLQQFDAMQGERHGHALAVKSGVTDVAIELTRMPMFKSRFEEVLEGLLEQRGGCWSYDLSAWCNK